MKSSRYTSESDTVRFIDDTIYEKEKYYTDEAKPYKVKKVYFTFLAEDKEGNEREFKEYEITTETKETVLLNLRKLGHEVIDYPNYILLNPDTDNEAVDVLYFENNFLFNDGDENNINFADRAAKQIHDELIRLRKWIAEQDAVENEEDEDYCCEEDEEEE